MENHGLLQLTLSAHFCGPPRRPPRGKGGLGLSEAVSAKLLVTLHALTGCPGEWQSMQIWLNLQWSRVQQLKFHALQISPGME